MNFQSHDRFVLRPDLVVEEVDDEVIVLDLAGNKYFGLDGVAFDIWQAIADGDCDLAQMAQLIAESYDISEERARRDTESFIDQLLTAGLAHRVDDGDSRAEDR